MENLRYEVKYQGMSLLVITVLADLKDGVTVSRDITFSGNARDSMQHVYAIFEVIDSLQTNAG